MRTVIGLLLLLLCCVAQASLAAPVPGTPQDDFLKAMAAADYAAAQRLVDQNRKPASGTNLAFWLNAQGMLDEAHGRFADAHEMFRQTYHVRRRLLGERHPETAYALNNMALMEEQQGRYHDALRHFRQALHINTHALGLSHNLTVTVLSNIGLLHLTMGDVRQADRELTKVLDLTTRAEGWWAQNTATSLSNLAAAKVTSFQFSAAEKLLKHALALDEYRHGPTHPDVAITLSNLGELDRLQARHLEAQQSFQRAAAIDRAYAGRNSHAYALDMLNLGALFTQAGRFREARDAIATAQAILATTAPDNPELAATALSTLAEILCRQDDCARAERLLKAASARLQARNGLHGAATLQVIANLAMLHRATGDFDQAALDMKLYVSGAETAFGRDSPVALRARLRWATALMENGDRTAARRAIRGLRRKILDIFGRSSVDAIQLDMLEARLALKEGHAGDASIHARRALRNTRTTFGANAMQAAEVHDLLATINQHQRQWQRAWRESRQALNILAQRVSRAMMTGHSGGPTRDSERTLLRNALTTAILASQHMRNRLAPLATALDAAELLVDDADERAMIHGAIQRNAGDPAALSLLRRQTALAAQMRLLDEQMADSFATGSFNRDAERLRKSMQDELGQLDLELAHRLPRYARLTGGQSITLHQLQRALHSGELVLYVIPFGETVAVLAITRDAGTAHLARASGPGLASDIDTLRAGLDPTRWKNSIEPFPREVAFRLYSQLLKPVAPLLLRSKTMFVIAAPPIDALPLSALVTSAPDGGLAGDSSPETLRRTAWLGTKIGIVRIPSAANMMLRDPRENDRSGTEAFLGIGAPVARTPGALPALPMAGRELTLMAGAFANGTPHVLAGVEATKAAFLESNPGSKRVIAFASHALTARESPSGEPALVLTQEAASRGKPYDTLTVSEIMKLDLSTDWVILSGCNTAGDGAGGTATLARAFLQAGARSLLVSHWPVSDRAAALMSTAVMSGFAAHPEEGQAQALRRAIGKTMSDTSHPLNAHPSTWAAFSLYGESAESPGGND